MICQHSSKERGMMCKRTASVCSVTFCVCARQSSLKKMARLGIHVTWRLISSSARTVKSSRMSLCPQFAFLVAVRPLLVNCSLLPTAFYFPVVDGKHNMASKHHTPVLSWRLTGSSSFLHTPVQLFQYLCCQMRGGTTMTPYSVYTARNSKVFSCVCRPTEANGAAHLNLYCGLFLGNSLLLDPNLDLITWHFCNVGKMRCIR